MDSEHTDLYRYFDAKGNLLYVGISVSAFQRLCQHRKDSKWYEKAVRLDIEKYDSRKKAEQAEREAIYNEKPVFNSLRLDPDEKVGPCQPVSEKYSGPIGAHLLNTVEAAEYLRLKKSTLEAWRSRGGGPTYLKFGKAVRYRPSDLDTWANERSFPHTSAYAS